MRIVLSYNHLQRLHRMERCGLLRKGAGRLRLASPVRLYKPCKLGEVDWSAISQGSDITKRFWGPIKVSDIAGKGRGVVANKNLKPGELLMISSPILFVRSEEGSIPDMDELLQQLYNTPLSPLDRTLLMALHNGCEDQQDRPAVQLPDLATAGEDDDSAASTVAEHDGEGAAGSSGRTRLSLEELSHDERSGALGLNMFGEQFQDMTLMLSRRSPCEGHLGIWADFAMLNHSCTWNALNFSVEDRMVVRAARAIRKGEEVCINYLGRAALAPVARRQEALEEAYGFVCSCPRCSVEVTEHASIAGQIEEWQSTVDEELAPALEAAAPARDVAAMQAAVQRIETMLADLEGQIQEQGLLDEEANWLKASAFELYSAYSTSCELLHMWSQSLPDDDVNIQHSSSSPSSAATQAAESHQPSASSTALFPSTTDLSSCNSCDTSAAVAQGNGHVPRQRLFKDSEASDRAASSSAMQQVPSMQSLSVDVSSRSSPAALHGKPNTASASGKSLARKVPVSQAKVASLARKREKALQQLFKIGAAAAPMSDLHLMLAVKALSLEQQLHGPASAGAIKAEKAAMKVLQARYGPVELHALERLLQGSAEALNKITI